MKTEAEIYRAHDILSQVITGEVEVGLHPKDKELALRAALDVLCWILGHEHNKAFAENLARIHAECERRGYVLVDYGSPQQRPQAREYVSTGPEAPSFTCPVCLMTSYNPNDVAKRYCGNCHTFFPIGEGGDG